MKSQQNPLIYTKLELVLQRLNDAVGSGYKHVICGEISPAKVGALFKKFDINYQISADKNLRARRKRNCLGNAKWIAYLKSDRIYWWLLVTPPSFGNHFAHSAEQLLDVTKPEYRLKFEQFELVKLAYAKPTKPTKPVKPSYKPRLKPARDTWRITLDDYESLRCQIIEVVRTSHAGALVGLIHYLYSLPGFGGVRSQVGKLVALYQSEVKRAGIVNAPKPLDTLHFVRRLANTGIRLSVLVESYKIKLAEVAHG